jgi:hypothetical protein
METLKYKEVLDEDLFEDGELNDVQVASKLFHRICQIGDWVVMEKDNND